MGAHYGEKCRGRVREVVYRLEAKGWLGGMTNRREGVDGGGNEQWFCDGTLT